MQRPVLGVLLAACVAVAICNQASDQCVVSAKQAPVNLKLVKTVSVSGHTYPTAAFCRINYVSATDIFAVTFSSFHTKGGREGGAGYFYKEYTTDLEFNGKTGRLFRGGGDAASVMVGNTYYFLTGGPLGMQLVKYDAATWRELNRIDIAVEKPNRIEFTNDSMLADVNGMLDASSLRKVTKGPANPYIGEASWHRFYTYDLEMVGYRIFRDVPHNGAGASMLFANGVYHYVTSTCYFGDLIVVQYDENGDYIGVKTLVKDAQWPQGAAYDESRKRFYVAYLDISNRQIANVHLGIFDKQWNHIADTAVTAFKITDLSSAGRPWVILHDNHAYVSYDVVTIDPITRETNKDWQGMVKAYEIVEQ